MGELVREAEFSLKVEGGSFSGITTSFSNKQCYKILVDGKIYYFDFSHMFGPLFLSKTHRILKNQGPPKRVFNAITVWFRSNKMIDDAGYCKWQEPMPEVVRCQGRMIVEIVDKGENSDLLPIVIKETQ